ncbi:Uu.00g108750.m01.CDS01 [Anthostomella pinea]|uniref:Uu.00g108750.m01.CDS01 n=1 Tax=Anthostomella pinea TaxID=933095 RepID=A0AAI8VEK9_9PEZI|nr:Uu.00g108750.m01.CDS01 [Anthostomella pinea]
MTRLPSDSFLPSGAILDPSPRSFISPLSLPHALNQTSYFERSHHLSPYPSPPAEPYQRSSGLSPTEYRNRPAAASPSMACTSYPRPGSPLHNASNESLAMLLQRREAHYREQERRWQGERTHLEQERARAEEMFREERDLMDQERMMYIDEKEKSNREISEWVKRAQIAENERDHLARLLKNMQSGAGGAQSFDGTTEAAIRGVRGGSCASPGPGRAPTVKFRSPSDGLSPGSIAGSTMPESKPFVPLDPRMQGPSPGTLSPTNEKEVKIPSIDVSEVIAGLEGVRLKKPAVQKPTFLDGHIQSPMTESRKSSPPAPHDESPEGQSRTSPAEMTKEALQAPEENRLTMHAGHTPNHSVSLSLLPTVDSTNATNTATSSGTPTPTRSTGEGSHQVAEGQPQPQPGISDDLVPGGSENIGMRDSQHNPQVDEEPILEPSDEGPALKGPLCLRNRPAADEPFLRSLTNKLQQVQAEEEPPSVLSNRGTSYATQDTTKPEPNAKASAAAGPKGANEIQDEAVEEVEEVIHLKLKKTSNFGLPLGRAH